MRDTVLHESSMHLNLKGWNFTSRFKCLIILREREWSCQCTEMDRKERLLEEDRMRSLQEIQEYEKDVLLHCFRVR